MLSVSSTVKKELLYHITQMLIFKKDEAEIG